VPETTTYQVTIGERVLQVQLRREGELTFVRVDDADEQPVQLGTVHGALRSLALGTRRAEVLAARQGDAIRVCIGGLDFRAEVLDARRARLAAVAGAAGPGGHARRELKAPMPGLVVKLLCQVGETVADGQPLAVLQAMKMENELSLPRGGVVQSINAEPGQTVEQGQVLVVLE
jgi:acetyl/propionyl-CoA carboxylase alpha subunit